MTTLTIVLASFIAGWTVAILGSYYALRRQFVEAGLSTDDAHLAALDHQRGPYPAPRPVRRGLHGKGSTTRPSTPHPKHRPPPSGSQVKRRGPPVPMDYPTDVN